MTTGERRLRGGQLDDPGEIVDQAIRKRAALLIGFKGNPKVKRGRLEEALKPTMMTMSLTGEPTLYPRISELNVEAKKRQMLTFLVTNGTRPKVLESMEPLPDQLYVSVSAPDKDTHNEITRPLIVNGWERLNKTLNLLPSLNTTKVIRLTMVKGWNMRNLKGYAEMIEKAEPTFVEVKAYEWVGESQRRLPIEAMPYMEDVRQFSREISNLTGYNIRGENETSGVVLLS